MMLSLPMFPFLNSFTAFTILSITLTNAAPAPDCDCFSTSSKNSPDNVFLSHLFIDFTSITPGANESFSEIPAPVSQGNGSEPVTSSYFNSNDFARNWQIQTWTQDANASADAPVELVNSAQNVFISKEPAILNLGL